MQICLDWLEERAAIFEFDAGISRQEAEAACIEIALKWCRETGEGPGDLVGSAYGHHFINLRPMITQVKGTREVVEYRWRHFDVVWRTSNFYTDEEAAQTFGSRQHERIEESRRVGKRNI